MAPHNRRMPSYAIFGNVLELRMDSKPGAPRGSSSVMYRYIVSPELIQLFYIIYDGGFNQELFSELSDGEKLVLSRAMRFLLRPENREFNIAVSKSLKRLSDRLSMIEGAVKAGNLSRALKQEYYTVIDKLVEAGSLRPHHGSYQKTLMERTPTTD